jgi:alkylhydroperoxidase family enzyme
MESTRQTLASDQQYSEIINGLVNQMKDVQVPDLLQAINRFHAFNSKFIDMR